MASTARDPHGRFKPGGSGNPAGKRPGTLNRATRLKRRFAAVGNRSEIEPLVARVAAGDVAAMRLLADRIARADAESPAFGQQLQAPARDGMPAAPAGGAEAPALPQHMLAPARDGMSAAPAGGTEAPCIAPASAGAGGSRRRSPAAPLPAAE